MLKPNRLLPAIAALLLISAGSARAAQPNQEELTELVQLLLGKIDRLETRLAVLEDTPATAGLEGAAATAGPLEAAVEKTAASDGAARPRTSLGKETAYLPSRGWREGLYYGSKSHTVAVHAFTDLEFVDAGPDGSRGGVSTFDSHHANLFVEAQLRPNLTAHVEFEFEHSGDEVEVDQAFVEWGVSNSLSLDIGRFYTPFGIERFVWYSPTNALVSRPEPMRQIVPGNFYANGIMALGSRQVGENGRFSYEFALSDGLGDNAATSRRGSRQTRDNNSNRAISSRLGLAPSRNWEIGASYHSQRYSSDGDDDLRFLGFDVSGRWKGWELRAEYVDAVLDTTLDDGTGGTVSGPDLDQDGWYGQLGYTFHWVRDFLPGLTLVTRYDSVDLDASVSGHDDRRLWSLGINALLYEHLRLKGEYRMADEDGSPLDNDTLLMQFVVDF